MKTTSAFLSVTFTVLLFAILSLEATYDRLNGTQEDPSVSKLDKQEFSQSILQESEKDILFIENLGQIKDSKGEKRPDILFLTRSEGVDMYMTNSGITYVFRKIESDISNQSQSALSKNTDMQDEPNFYRLDMEFVGMNKNITIRKDLAVEQQYHYYTPEYPDGKSPKAYKKITIENLYEGIDMVYYEKEGRMKYDFILKAGADAGKIQMKYMGASSMDIDKEGNVIISTPMGEIREEKPYTYSESTAMEIESRYRVKDNTVLFDIEEYDEREDIIIDPVRIWATYYGGNGFDLGRSVCTDNSGNLYVTGRTSSSNFPVQSWTGAYNQTTFGGERDVFILKFNGSGERIWATYYGGSNHDVGWGVCSDNSGNLYVTGSTESSDFPTQTVTGAYNQTTYGGGEKDAFILKFDSSGERIWATYYGGSDLDRGISICTDTAENIYLTGITESDNFPTQSLAGAYNQATSGDSSDAFILKFNSSCVRQWATYYGGNGHDEGLGICTDISANIYVTGKSGSNDFPTQNLAGAYNQTTQAGSYDGFILKFNNNGARQWATYYGGSGDDEGLGLCTDNSGNIYVTGGSGSSDFPTQNLAGAYNQATYGGGDWDAFILKFDSNSVRQWATYYGGYGPLEEFGRGLCTDNGGNLYVTGDTRSTDFPIQTFPGGYNQTTAGGQGGPGHDVFILIFNSNGARQWATYYGGGNSEYGYGICLDNASNIYITGPTWAPDFPTQALTGSYNQTTLDGVVGVDFDAFILRFGVLHADFSASDCAFGTGGMVTFTDQSLGTSNSWNWIFEGGTPATSTEQHPVVTYDTIGSYDVQLIVSDGTNSDTLLEDYLITVHGSGPGNCAPNIDFFPADPLTHSGTGSNSTTLSFSPPHWDVGFTVSDISQKLNGKPSNKFIEKVTVSYIDCAGQNQTYGTFSAASVSSVNISIQDVVQSVTVILTDDLDGDSGNSTMSVSLDAVSSCTAPEPLPPVADFEGTPRSVTVGNSVDFTDLSLNNPTSWDWSFEGGTPASSTEQNPTVTYNSEGVYTVSLTVTNSDGSDAETKLNYITVVDAGCTSVSNDFPTDPLTHSGTGSSSTTYDYGTPGHTDVSFVVSGLGAKINGNPNNRYIDFVTVTYTDAGGTQTYGTFSGENTSSANVDIAGPVYSVTLILDDAYDGNPPGTLSVDPGSISSCPPSEALLVANDDPRDWLDNNISDLSVYPNPAREILTIRYQLNRESEIMMWITDIKGVPVYDLHTLLRADMQENHIDVSQMPAGVYLLHLGSKDQVISRKFVVLR